MTITIFAEFADVLYDQPPSDKIVDSGPKEKIMPPEEKNKQLNTNTNNSVENKGGLTKNQAVVNMQKAMFSLGDELKTATGETLSIIDRNLARFKGPKISDIIGKINSISNVKQLRGNKQVTIADGSWGDKTTEALKEIQKLINLIADICGILGIKNHNSNTELNFSQAMESHLKNPKELTSVAELLTTYIDNIRISFANLIRDLQEKIGTISPNTEINTKYKSPYTNKQGQADEDRNVANTLSLVGDKLPNKTIPLSSLDTAESLKNYMSKNVPNEDKSEEFSNDDTLKFLASLEDGIRNKTIIVSKPESNQGYPGLREGL